MPESRSIQPTQSALALTLALAIGSAACTSKPLRNANDDESSGGANAAPAGGAAGIDSEPQTLPLLDGVHVSSDEHGENFQRVSAAIDWGSDPVARAVVRVSLSSPCFPFAAWADLGVPSGQNWPEPCDAFDRTLSLTIDASATDTTAPPGVELLRAITPFGGPLELEADVTDVVNGLPGAHELGLRIDTWSDANGLVSGSHGEWVANVELRTWAGAAPRKVLAVIPLALEEQTEVEAAPVSFTAPEATGSARLEYRVTGHGAAFGSGCLGGAEEFCRRNHELWLDDELLADLVPWREDCAALCTWTANDTDYGPRNYCAENPCGSRASVTAPRANWCPGSMTPPIVIDDARLAGAGGHQLARKIPELAPGGQWRVSATYFAFE